jgi:hypothetical protein
MTAIRHFDAFTDERLALVKASLRPGEPSPGPFDQRYLVPDVEKLSENMKTTAEHSMVGLWYHAGANRESLDVVMMRCVVSFTFNLYPYTPWHAGCNRITDATNHTQTNSAMVPATRHLPTVSKLSHVAVVICLQQQPPAPRNPKANPRPSFPNPLNHRLRSNKNRKLSWPICWLA